MKKNRQHNGQNDKQPSTKLTYKTKDPVTRTPLKTGGELRCTERVSSSCSTNGTRRVNLVKNPVMISHEWGNSFGHYDNWNVKSIIYMALFKSHIILITRKDQPIVANQNLYECTLLTVLYIKTCLSLYVLSSKFL